MGLFDLELQPAHQIARRAEIFFEEELDLFGISDRKTKRDREIVENTDFDQEIEFFRMKAFPKESMSPKMKKNPVSHPNDHRPNISQIDDNFKRQPEYSKTMHNLKAQNSASD
jgi:hypothetical protein